MDREEIIDGILESDDEYRKEELDKMKRTELEKIYTPIFAEEVSSVSPYDKSELEEMTLDQIERIRIEYDGSDIDPNGRDIDAENIEDTYQN